jgi:glycosyltransferase involved in cell wall biosynthesis
MSGRIPSLLTVHDLSFVHYPETFTPALVSYLNRVVPRSVRRATHILADSQATRQDLIQLWDVPKEKITVLLSGVHERFQPVTEEQTLAAVRKKYDLGVAPYLLSLSTIHPRKNYQMLIRAFRPLADRFPHNLVIGGGKGWLYEDVFAEVEQQGLAGRVLFIGFVDDADLPALYSEASLFVFPSLYEGFGLPLLEAMACGVPVVSSNASSLPEVAGKAARLLNPEAQHQWTRTINDLLIDSKARVKMIAAGYRQARVFTWERAAVKLLEVYDNLL